MKFRLLLLGSMVGCTVLTGLMLSSNVATADDPLIDVVSFTVEVSCTMLGTGQNSHYTDITNGTYEDEVGSTTLKVLCNDSEGFAIYAIGFTGDQYNGDDHTKLIGVNTNQKISTGTATSGDTSNWAMKLATDGTATYPITLDNGYGSYSVVPDVYTKVAHRASGTDIGTSAVGATLTTTYASFMSSGQMADAYVGKVKYTLVRPASSDPPLHPSTATSGCINYFPNGSNVEGTMGCQEITSSDTSATLLAANFSRTGYGFAGWSDAFDYATNANAHFYGPQEDITFTAGQYTGTNDGLALYAVWVKSAGSLQDTSKVATLCGTGTGSLTAAPTDGTADLDSVSALTDQRDNQTYAIAKLADGKCWMIENLRLESTAAHNSDGTLAQGYGTSATYGNFGGLATAESAGFSRTYSANSLYSNDGSNDTINIGTSNYPGYRMPRYNNTNTSTRASSPTTNNTAMYNYGNYYTWHAAIADLTYNGTNNNSVTNTSLCPAGWHLPKGGDKSNEANNDFWSLVVTGINGGTNPANYGSNTNPYYTGTAEAGPVTTKLRSYPNNFLYSGCFQASSARDRSSLGYYWSSTASDSDYSYSLYLYSSYVNPGTGNNYKSSGYSIRCTVSAGT